MKTVISLPQELSAAADVLARRMGISRSELCTRAVAEYVAKHRDEDVTARLNEVHAQVHRGLDARTQGAQALSVRSPGW